MHSRLICLTYMVEKTAYATEIRRRKNETQGKLNKKQRETKERN